MAFEITCPNCGHVFEEDKSKFTSIVQQIRDHEFDHDLQARIKLVEDKHAADMETAKARLREEAQAAAAKKDEEIATLRERVEATSREAQLDAQKALGEKDAQIAQLQARIATAEKDRDAALQEAIAQREATIVSLRTKLQAQADGAANERDLAVEKAVSEAREHARASAASKDEEIAALRERIQAVSKEAELQTQKELTEKDAIIAQLRTQLDATKQAADQESRLALAQKDAEISQLQAQIDAEASRQELAVAQAVAQAEKTHASELRAIERERDDARNQMQLAAAEKAQLEAQMREQKIASEQTMKDIVALKDAELERIRDLRSKTNVKLLGETLEQHCEAEFEKMRPFLPNVEFHKDNEAVRDKEDETDRATKGDYIYRETDGAGHEILSIMFEMKNEDENATHHRTNESHLAKLDRDRRKKKCEYAVLVSTLEAESEVYNQGIVDVSWRGYEKTFVIRPQFFATIIALLRNMAWKSADLRVELEKSKAASIDVTHFEEKLEKFRSGFVLNYNNAVKQIDNAIVNIDKAIADLEKVKKNFQTAKKHLGAADGKVERLTIRSLTRGNPTIKAALDEARDKKALDGADGADADDGADAIEPDAIE